MDMHIRRERVTAHLVGSDARGGPASERAAREEEEVQLRGHACVLLLFLPGRHLHIPYKRILASHITIFTYISAPYTCSATPYLNNSTICRHISTTVFQMVLWPYKMYCG